VVILEILINDKVFADENKWMNNEFPPQPKEEGFAKWMYPLLKLCFSQDTENCPTLDLIYNEVNYYLIKCYCREKSDECDLKAIEVILSEFFQVDY
jgi:hypothetical protein